MGSLKFHLSLQIAEIITGSNPLLTSILRSSTLEMQRMAVDVFISTRDC